MQRKARIFMNNRSQAVRLPKEFQFQTQEVFIRREGSEVVLSPRPFDWTSYLAEGPVASAKFMNNVEDLPVQERELYMLDTDTCSYIMKRSNSGVLKRLSTLPVSDVCISVITKSELLFGVEVSPRRRQDQGALDAFLNYIEVLGFPDQASLHYARIRADLRRLGTQT